MNVEKLYNIIDTVNIAGIDQIIIDKNDNGVTVRGADIVGEGEEVNIVILSDTDSDVVDKTMGIHRTSVLHRRMSLFDLSKTKSNTVDSETFVKSLSLNESRKKVSFTFADPKTIDVPTGSIDDEINTNIKLSEQTINELVKANAAMGSEFIKIKGINKDIIIELFDGISDTFTDRIGSNTSGDWSYQWSTNSILRLAKHAIKSEPVVEFGIGEQGILYIEVNDLIFMIMPQTV